MCAIAGASGVNVDGDFFLRSLIHRGRDASGRFETNDIALFHNRLSIVDLDGGSQPMSIGKYTIVFNGEIYNHLNLRKKYLGNSCISTSDTETLLRLFILLGNKCLDLLDGMFAFAIFDDEEKTLFLARDRAGEKPLYYHKTNSSFVFASEIYPIAKSLDLDTNEDAICAYIHTGFFAHESAYKGLMSMKAGSYMIVDLHSYNVQEHRYFSMQDLFEQKPILDMQESLEAVEVALKKSVHQRLISSDVEVGAFLSGGIDSALVVAMASAFVQNLRTLTISFDGSYDESPQAQLVAKKYGLKHEIIRIDENLSDFVLDVLQGFSQPFFDSSAIVSYLVSRHAKKSLNVVLTGDGADELFGGYRRYMTSTMVGYMRFLSPILHVLPSPKDKLGLYAKLHRLLNLGRSRGVLDGYLRLTTNITSGYEKFFRLPKDFEIEQSLSKINASDLTKLQKMMVSDFDNILAFDLLPKIDITSMQNTLELRSPFLSKELLSLSARVIDSHKIRPTKTKYILRLLAQKYLPQELINAPKRGFEVPLDRWVNEDLRELIFDMLHPKSYAASFVDDGFLSRLKNNSIDMPQQMRTKMLWVLFTIQAWKNNN